MVALGPLRLYPWSAQIMMKIRHGNGLIAFPMPRSDYFHLENSGKMLAFLVGP